VGLARADRLDVTSIPAVCLGPETAAVAREAGFTVVAVSAAPEARVLATTASRALAAVAAHPKETR
jgi:uroporphyrinogen-III synthase